MGVEAVSAVCHGMVRNAHPQSEMAQKMQREWDMGNKRERARSQLSDMGGDMGRRAAWRAWVCAMAWEGGGECARLSCECARVGMGDPNHWRANNWTCPWGQ